MSNNGNGDSPTRKRGRPPGPCPTPYTRRYRPKFEGVKSVARDGLDLMPHEEKQVRVYTENQQASRDVLEARAKAGDIKAMGELWQRLRIRYPLAEQSVTAGPGRASTTFPGSAGPWEG